MANTGARHIYRVITPGRPPTYAGRIISDALRIARVRTERGNPSKVQARGSDGWFTLNWSPDPPD